MHRAAHRHDAARARWWLAGVQLPADDGAGAIGADQQITFDERAVGEAQADATVVGGEPDCFAAERQRVRPDRVEERSVERRAQRHEERPPQRVRRQRGAFEHGAVHAAQLTAARREAAGQHRLGHAERPQCGNGVGREAEPESQLARRGRTLEDAHAPASLAQGDAGRQPADPGADDQGGARHTAGGSQRATTD